MLLIRESNSFDSATGLSHCFAIRHSIVALLVCFGGISNVGPITVLGTARDAAVNETESLPSRS